MSGFNYKKAIQALAFFAEQCGGKMNKMKAIKLIWLSDRLHLRQYARTITGDVYFALPYGPVASTTRDLLENNDTLLSDIELNYTREFLGEFTKYTYEVITKPNLKVFSKTDLECLHNVFTKFGHLNPFELSELSHSYPEWKRYENQLNNGTYSRFEIDLMDFFTNTEEESDLFNQTTEYLDISKEMYTSKTGLRQY